MNDVLHLTTYGATRDEALLKAREVAADYFSTYPHLVKGKVDYAFADYVLDEPITKKTPEQIVTHFTVESKWSTLDSGAEWLVG